MTARVYQTPSGLTLAQDLDEWRVRALDAEHKICALYAEINELRKQLEAKTGTAVTGEGHVHGATSGELDDG